jgi:hypothetical protein
LIGQRLIALNLLLTDSTQILAIYQFPTGFSMSGSDSTDSTNFKPEQRFIICSAYYFLSNLTEYGDILFLANGLLDNEASKWVTDFEQAHSFDTKEMPENTIKALQNNFQANDFSGDSLSVIVVALLESN